MERKHLQPMLRGNNSNFFRITNHFIAYNVKTGKSMTILILPFSQTPFLFSNFACYYFSISQLHTLWCLRYCKYTNFSANHNPETFVRKISLGVCDTANIRIFRVMRKSPCLSSNKKCNIISLQCLFRQSL